MHDYWSEENQLKRLTEINQLQKIQDQITELQKQYNKLTEQYSEDNIFISINKYIIYTLVDNVPYNWNSEGPTHIGDIADKFEEESGWLSSSTRCE